MSPDKLVPFRWPSTWTDPEVLKLFTGSPINCLLLDSVRSQDRIADAARQAGLTVVEWNSLAAAPLGEVKWNSPASQTAISGLAWPRMKLTPRDKPDDAEAGPTGAPWIDSNSWVARLAAVRAPGRPVWLGFEPIKDEPAPSEAGYTVAVADAAAAGARWMISLDDALLKGLPAGNPDALQKWRAMLAAVSFFERHRDWSTWKPWGPVGVLSSFAGKDEFLGQEMLNLAARRNLLYRILDRSIPASQRFDGLRAVLYVDSDPPSTRLKAALSAFARAGGLLIVPRALAASFPAERPWQCPVDGYRLGSFGKGSVAAAVRDWDDPYFLAADVHSLVSRRHDPVRLFNGRSAWLHYSVAPNGRAALLQLVCFTSRPIDSVSMTATQRWRSALMHTIGTGTPAVLEPVTVDGQAEFQLPRFSFYAAVEFQS